MDELIIKGRLAKAAVHSLGKLSSEQKNAGLLKAAQKLIEKQDDILKANAMDLAAAHAAGIKGALIDRLTLTEKRIAAMADGLLQLTMLEDPVGEVLSMKKRPNGLVIGQKRVPMGVIGIIYEARPNVTVDAFGLCLKTSNVVILRGGKEAIHANKAIVSVLKEALEEAHITPDAVHLIEDTSRETAKEMMRLNQFLDVLIPRGGAGLIQTVIQNSTVPVIETGVGNCHVFVDSQADLDMAVQIVVNAKTHRPGVCNAAESLLVHKDIADSFIPKVCSALIAHNVEIRGDAAFQALEPQVKPAAEEDWGTEYLDYIMSAKVVDSLDDAISHIGIYGTKHSEAIVTNNYEHAQRFLEEVDAAAVYVNASTRFTDGFEFGFGAEIGISTQKLHARGPMGLKELTTTKYIIYGSGQIRQ